MRTLLALGAAAATAAAGGANDVWPMPQSFVQGQNAATLTPSFSISCSGLCPAPLAPAFARYTNMIFFAGAATPSGATITSLSVSVDADTPLLLGVNESYTLNVPSAGQATIAAPTQWGALRALETFSQLFAWSTDAQNNNVYTAAGLPVAIADFPRFAWRGILVDSSRHFLSVDALKITMDAMSYNKMNRMHWHVVDDNSWPLYSERYPNFTIGAYAPDAIYTHTDIQELVQFAFERGISIVPEFDLPAHSLAWERGYPDLIINCPDGQSLADPTPDGKLYATVQGLLQEFVPLFNTDYVHFGGDEVHDLTCWSESLAVQAFMKAQGYSNVDQVRNYFQTQLQELAIGMNLSTMFWEEVFDNGYDLKPTSIIDVWLSDEKLLEVIKEGNRVVESYGLYLDQQTPDGGLHYFWMDTLLNFYLHDPLYNVTVTPAEAALVLGMSTSMWGEQVDDASIVVRMWPRASAAAERMWSDAGQRDTSEIFTRIEKLRCAMLRRGIRSGPVRPADMTGYCALPASSPILHSHVDWSAK